MPAVMNAANDALVAKFLAGECEYLDIPRVIKEVMHAHEVVEELTLETASSYVIERLICSSCLIKLLAIF